MEGIFQSVGLDRRNAVTEVDDTEITYENYVKALIEDACDYDHSELSPIREENIKYYEGLLPSLDSDTIDGPVTGDYMAPDDEEGANQSTAVSSDVRDTVLAIMPSLMRIFTSGEHVAYFTPSSAKDAELAKQQTDFIEKTIWDENDGFMVLHDVFKDALTQKVGIVMWWTETETEVKYAKFTDISLMQLSNMLDQYASAYPEAENPPEVTEMIPSEVEGMVKSVTIRYQEASPKYCIESVPPEEFRVDRRARHFRKGRLVGRQTLQSPSYLVKRGIPAQVIEDYVGKFNHYSVEADLRVPGIDTGSYNTDLVEWGEYFIRVDADGDGIDELRYICVIGDNYDIVIDEPADDVNMSVFCGDPKPHTVIGDSMADLVKDIQKINTQILRGSLDSLSASMNPDLVFNEMMTNAQDVMAGGVGRLIRTTGDPNAAVKEFRTSFIGSQAFEMMGVMDGIRQRRTGISEASKGIDPKALQSTNQVGVEAIVSGAQERIELIARIFAETGLKYMYQGLLREICRSPNKPKTYEVRGQWVDFDPSLFDPNLKVKVNPTMGKGSDMTRLMALQAIKSDQLMIMEKFGVGNTFVTPRHFMNTVADIMAIANIKDTSRYFGEVTDEMLKALQEAPKEPSPEDKIATAELEKVRSQTAKNVADLAQRDQQRREDDDFRRDKLTLDTMSKVGIALAKVNFDAIKATLPTIEMENQSPNGTS